MEEKECYDINHWTRCMFVTHKGFFCKNEITIGDKCAVHADIKGEEKEHEKNKNIEEI